MCGKTAPACVSAAQRGEKGFTILCFVSQGLGFSQESLYNGEQAAANQEAGRAAMDRALEALHAGDREKAVHNHPLSSLLSNRVTCFASVSGL